MKFTTAPVAYFCSEYALNNDESMYAGGLGVLAADFLFEAAEENLSFVAVGLKYDKSKIDGDFDLLKNNADEPVVVEVPIEDKKVFLQAWFKKFSDETFLILLDSNVEANAESDRAIGDLYDSRFNIRIKQQIYLGVGGVRLLKLLNIEPKRYHLNEGNTAFAALALLAEKFTSIDAVREMVVATKHTILTVGAKIPIDDLWYVIGKYCEVHNITKDELITLGPYKDSHDVFSTTKFLLSLAGKANGVSVSHTVFEKQKYPESTLIPITNGVYVKRWRSNLWLTENDKQSLSDEKIWSIKRSLREQLLADVEKLSGVKLNPDACTVVWARRFVSYKRPFAIFSDMQRLARIVSDGSRPIQIIISGREYEADEESKGIIEKVRSLASDPVFKGKIVFVYDYSIDLAKKFVAGADIWLNTPELGIEACGTSGMKAALNGALMASVSDGWMAEIDWQGIGWILDSDNLDLAGSIYDVLENQVAPEFYDCNVKGLPQNWLKRMCKTMAVVDSGYSAKRMLGDYIESLY